MNDNTELPDHYIRLFTHGFVGLQEHMGSDASIVSAARTSYSTGTTVSRSDVGLINYLMRKRHTSPFEMGEVRLHMRAPIFVLRQWIRHRTANVNEESGRYSVLADDFYVPEPDEITGQSETNKQMAGGVLNVDIQSDATTIITVAGIEAFADYRALLEKGVARETARTVLPVGTFSTVVWKCDIHNLLHLLHLRMDEKHAQPQTLAYAKAIHDLVQPLFPATFAAWENYVRKAVTFSASEQKLLALVIEKGIGVVDYLKFGNELYPEGMSKSEVGEFIEKMSGLRGAAFPPLP